MRRVFIVLSSKSLPYAHACIRTMLGNCAEPVSLHLIADDTEEQRILVAETAAYARPGRAVISVISEEEVADRIADRFPGLDGLRALHQGHPCWRKIIDPLALSAPEEEIIVADPDLFFPNRFDFEPMPQQGVLMMRQGPNCLYPPAAVRAAFDHGLRLANHVDIGVAQVRAGTIDPEWLDWAVRPLVQSQLSSFMHIEAIVWSALAMQYGGQHLQPKAWHCWERGLIKRAAVALGLPGHWALRLERLERIKCIHASGPSKWWVQQGLKTGAIREFGVDRTGPTTGTPYVELTRAGFEREQRLKSRIKRFVPA
jgi:hypothetical protein